MSNGETEIRLLLKTMLLHIQSDRWHGREVQPAETERYNGKSADSLLISACKHKEKNVRP